MKIDVNGAPVFVSTGGREFDPNGTVLLLLHGSGQTHLTWMLQGRFLANRGWQLLMPDLPAHGLSGGEALTSIRDMAEWCADLLKQTGVKRAHVVGHSQGGLVGLELASSRPEVVASLSLVATALAIPVNPALLDMAQNREEKAIAAMTDWGHGREGHFHDATLPGLDQMNFGRHLMANNETGALFADLSACANYDAGEDAARSVACPCLCILAENDKMTPLKQGRKMAAALTDAREIVISGAGHMLPGEKPDEVLKALRVFLPHPA
ncbi:alpha/beta hydrolase [Hoeflea sp. CAU 1731]